MTFTEIPPDAYYPGMTRYTAPDGRTFACMGVGDDRRKALVERAEDPVVFMGGMGVEMRPVTEDGW